MIRWIGENFAFIGVTFVSIVLVVIALVTKGEGKQ